MRLLLLMLMLVAARAEACSFVAVLGREGARLAELDADASLYYDFLQDHAAPPNDDGYGLLYYNKPRVNPEQSFYATGAEVWYLHDDGRALETALAAIRDPANQAVLALGHARNGSGGAGSHPFTFDWRDQTYAFMHNGDLSNGTSAGLKEALLHGLIQSGWFISLPPSRWSNWNGDPEDVDSWIDSELLFHYFMAAILAADGDVVAGLREALNNEDYYGFNVRADLVAEDPEADPASIINFVLCDGRSLFVYKNSSPTDEHHELSYRLFSSGLAGVFTDNEEGSLALDAYELVTIPADGGRVHHEDINADPASGALPNVARQAPHRGWSWPPRKEELEAPGLVARSDEAATAHPPAFALLPARPNPCNPSTTIRLRLSEAVDLHVAIYDLSGRQVATLFEGQLSAGAHELPWSGQTDAGRPAASGLYVCVASSGRAVQSEKLLLLQ
jgi:hypothetical protein